MADQEVEEALSLELAELSIKLLGEKAAYFGNKTVAAFLREFNLHRTLGRARGHGNLVLPPNGPAVQLRPTAAGGVGCSTRIDAKRLTQSIEKSGGVSAATA